MGETAELLLEGVLCENCGCYIGEAVGYTRVCDECDDC